VIYCQSPLRLSLAIHDKTIAVIVEAQRQNWIVCSATNQQAIGKHLVTHEGVSEIHNLINEGIKKSGGKPLLFFVCPHLQSDLCPCRKPKPGLIFQALETYGFNEETDHIVFVGDQETDRLAAESAGITFVPYSNEFSYFDIARTLS